MQREYRTKSRQDILEFIKSHKERRFSAADIYDYLKKKDSNINLTTIYRNLERMTGKGEVLKFNSAQGEYSVFQYHEPGQGCDAHIHMQCRECGRIIHMEEEFMDYLNSYLRERCAFSLNMQESVLVGVCSGCDKG